MANSTFDFFSELIETMSDNVPIYHSRLKVYANLLDSFEPRYAEELLGIDDAYDEAYDEFKRSRVSYSDKEDSESFDAETYYEED